MNESRLCPHCGVALTPTSLLDGHPVEVDVCPRCRGIWFDVDELEQVLEAVRHPEARVDRRLISSLAERHATPTEVRYVPCPICAERMNRCAHGHRSGIVVDRCHAHGVWLDGGELEVLFEWGAAGGHILDMAVRDEARMAEQRRERAVALESYGSDPLCLTLGPRRQSSGWLADALGDFIARMLS